MRERAHLRGLAHPITHPECLRASGKPTDESVVDPFVYVEARRRHADLAGVAEFSDNRLIQDLLDVDVIEHQHRRVPPELHRRTLHTVGRKLQQLFAHDGRAREGDRADDRRGEQVRRHFRGNSEHD